MSMAGVCAAFVFEMSQLQQFYEIKILASLCCQIAAKQVKWWELPFTDPHGGAFSALKWKKLQWHADVICREGQMSMTILLAVYILGKQADICFQIEVTSS